MIDLSIVAVVDFVVLIDDGPESRPPNSFDDDDCEKLIVDVRWREVSFKLRSMDYFRIFFLCMDFTIRHSQCQREMDEILKVQRKTEGEFVDVARSVAVVESGIQRHDVLPEATGVSIALPISDTRSLLTSEEASLERFGLSSSTVPPVAYSSVTSQDMPESGHGMASLLLRASSDSIEKALRAILQCELVVNGARETLNGRSSLNCDKWNEIKRFLLKLIVQLKDLGVTGNILMRFSEEVSRELTSEPQVFPECRECLYRTQQAQWSADQLLLSIKKLRRLLERRAANDEKFLRVCWQLFTCAEGFRGFSCETWPKVHLEKGQILWAMRANQLTLASVLDVEEDAVLLVAKELKPCADGEQPSQADEGLIDEVAKGPGKRKAAKRPCSRKKHCRAQPSKAWRLDRKSWDTDLRLLPRYYAAGPY